jgi:folate-dependent phosphoribosylglycinamide formyltransferase PurN
MPFRFEGLEIWKRAREFSAKIHGVTVHFPRHEMYEWGDALARKINAFRNTLK